MTRFRAAGWDADHRRAGMSHEVFLIEDSVAMGLLLQGRITAKASARVSWFRTYADAADALADRRPVLAVTGTSLADAPAGQIIDLLADHDIPTILFTATLDRKARKRFNGPTIIDYFCKDMDDSVAQVVRTVARFTDRPPPPVLIVDDMASGRGMLAELLRHQHYRIFEAASGQDALRLLADQMLYMAKNAGRNRVMYDAVLVADAG